VLRLERRGGEAERDIVCSWRKYGGQVNCEQHIAGFATLPCLLADRKVHTSWGSNTVCNGVVAATFGTVPTLLPTEMLSRSYLQGGALPCDQPIRSADNAKANNGRGDILEIYGGIKADMVDRMPCHF